MTAWQIGFLIWLALALISCHVLARAAKNAPIRNDWRSSRDEAWERHTDQAVAIGNGLACGDRLATDLAAVMAPQLIDAAEQLTREASA